MSPRSITEESRKGITLTKVVCTIGGKSRTVAELQALLEAGMSVARFDFSFGDHAYHSQTLNNLRRAMKITGRNCATMLGKFCPVAPVAITFGKRWASFPQGSG